jgi:hypothetical protein
MSGNSSLAKFLFPLSLFVAWFFDFLFWDKAIGISFPLFIFASLAAGLWLAAKADVSIPRRSAWLLLPIAFFALIGLWRVEPFSLFLSRSLALFLMALFAANLIGGRWPAYSLSDFIAKIGVMPFSGLTEYRQISEAENAGKERLPWRKRLAPLGRGLLIASPIVVVLAALLASADLIFEAWLQNLLEILQLENLAEYLWRLFYILILAYLLIGVYSYAIKRSQDSKLIGEDKPVLSPFIGFTEALTGLISVEILFAICVGIQVRYFFGGNANINNAGYTFAEYARRGFAELVIVALISVALFVGLSLISRREKPGQKAWFSRLGGGLFVLITIILVSAYQRLLLYESVFGFTRTRANVHVFMIWLGLLLVTLVILEARGQRRAFTLAALLVVIGYGASINLLNVDAFIVRANAERLRQSEEIDIAYLGSLSSDSLRPLLSEINNSSVGGDPDYQAQLLAAAACLSFNQNEFQRAKEWQAFSFSGAAANKGWAVFEASEDFERIEMPAEYNENGLITAVDQLEFNCVDWAYWD